MISIRTRFQPTAGPKANKIDPVWGVERCDAGCDTFTPVLNHRGEPRVYTTLDSARANLAVLRRRFPNTRFLLIEREQHNHDAPSSTATVALS